MASAAVYDVPEIVEALAAALDRGVTLRIVAEDPEAGPGKVAYGARAAFGSQILTRAPIYVWPREQRPRDEKGRQGSLHVKCAVADGRRLLVSSANLTGYAMELNMEMGLLVHQQELSRRIEEHFAALVEWGYWSLGRDNSCLTLIEAEVPSKEMTTTKSAAASIGGAQKTKARADAKAADRGDSRPDQARAVTREDAACTQGAER